MRFWFPLASFGEGIHTSTAHLVTLALFLFGLGLGVCLGQEFERRAREESPRRSDG